jgi:hypothetical protein
MTDKNTKKGRSMLWNILVGVLVLTCLCLFIFFVIFSSGSHNAGPNPTNNSNQPNSSQSSTATAETATPEPKVIGEARDNPFPMGAVIDIGSDMSLKILDVKRPADRIVHAGNMFNATPEPNSEYAIINLQIQCNKSTNEKCSFDAYSVKAVGQDGNVRDQASAAGIANQMESISEFFGGSKLVGNIVFLISKNDKSTVLFYEALFGSPVYFAIP